MLGAPRALPDGAPGSRLGWSDVLEAAWRCYNPLKDLAVRDILADSAVSKLHECSRHQKFFETGQGTVGKQLVAVRWIAGAYQSRSLLLCPTAKRIFAGIVARTQQGGPLALRELPEESSFDCVTLDGGFAVIHDQGALLFDDWRDAPLRFERMTEEFDNAIGLLGEILRINAELDGMVTGQAMQRKTCTHRILTRVAELRVSLAKAKQKYAPRSHHDDVRRFRSALEQHWGLAKAVDDLYKRAAEIEESQRTLTALQTRDLMSWISTYRLPFIVSGAITQSIGPWLESARWVGYVPRVCSLLSVWITDVCKSVTKDSGVVAVVKVGVYLGLALTMVFLFNGIQQWRARAMRGGGSRN